MCCLNHKDGEGLGEAVWEEGHADINAWLGCSWQDKYPSPLCSSVSIVATSAVYLCMEDSIALWHIGSLCHIHATCSSRHSIRAVAIFYFYCAQRSVSAYAVLAL